jgi:fucose 4-O-acetylase-like acetyltransferase
MKKENIQFVSVAKGIGILSVVLLHTISPEMRDNNMIASGLFKFIHSFCLPLFFVISGYLFELNINKYVENGFLKFTLVKFKLLIIPYLSYSAISYLGINIALRIPAFSGILSRGGYEKVSIPEAIFQIVTCTDHIDKHLWFIYIMFFIFIISYLFRNITKNPYFLLTISLLYIILKFNDRNSDLLYLACFNIARHSHIINYMLQKKIFILTAILSLIFLLIITLLDGMAIRTALEIPIAVVSILTIITASKKLVNTRICNMLLMFGKSSYEIYMIHQPFIVSGTIGILMATSNLKNPLIGAIAFILGVSLPLAISKFILNRWRILRILFLGRYKT